MKSISCLRTLYHKNGYALIKKAIPDRICQKMIQQIQVMKNKSGFLSNYSQDLNSRNHLSSTFYVDSVNKVSHFFENTYQKDESLDRQSMIKIGHALHTNKLFGQVTFGKSILETQKLLGITQSIVLQSMVLEKLPKKGGKVTMHQDSTYLFSEPDTVNGYWLPLQDATRQNGCIWLIPGSHTSKLYSKFKVVNGIPSYEFNGPMDFKQQQSIPIEMQRGDLLIFHGRVIHKSNDNTSNTSRYAYTWHTMEKVSKWSQENWLSFEEINKYQTYQI